MISFQVLDWYTEDVPIASENDEPSEYPEKELNVYLFGRTLENKSITVVATGYMPSFYLLLPENNTKSASQILNILKTAFKKDKQTYWLCAVTKEAKIAHKKKAYGFTNGKMFPFLQLFFSTQIGFYGARKFFTNNNFGELYESNIDPLLRFIHLLDIEASGWVEVNKYDAVEQSTGEDCDNQLSNSNLEIITDWHNLKKDTTKLLNAPIRIASFDIETTSLIDKEGHIIDPDGKVIQIATTFTIHGQPEPYLKHIITLKKCLPIEGSVVQFYDNEKEVLLAWTKIITEQDPDLFIGYNIFGFDFQYMFERAKKLKIDTQFAKLGRLNHLQSQQFKKHFESGAFGHNDYFRVSSVGRIQLDVLDHVRRGLEKHESYKMDKIAKRYLGEDQGKIDLGYKELASLFQRGNPADIHKIAVYCIQDTQIPQKLLDCRELNILTNIIEMSKVTDVPISYIIDRGQNIKSFSQIAKQAMLDNFVIPVLSRKTNQGGYQGATVLEPKHGFYTEPVVGLDFASLYPSIMIAHKLCHTNLVLDQQYNNLPDIQYDTIEYDYKGQHHCWTFAQQDGLIPKIERKLLAERKKVKQEMKNEKDEKRKSMLDGKQLAIKVSCNSVYGFCGAENGSFPCLAIASCITAKGRQMLEHTKKMAEDNFKCTVIYGDTDSCYIKFDVSSETEPDKKIQKSFAIGYQCAQMITKTFKQPIELALEKVYFPIILLAKKRYVALKYEPKNPADPTSYGKPKMDSKGLVLIRRDNCPLVKKVYGKLINILMESKDVELAITFIKQSIDDLLAEKFAIDDFIISKSLKKDYDNPKSQPHWQVAQKIEKRNAGSGPKSNDRVPYVYIVNKRATLDADKAEDPDYVIKNKETVKIDYAHYLEKQLREPIVALLELLMPKAKALAIFNDNIIKQKTKQAGQTTIDRFFRKN